MTILLACLMICLLDHGHIGKLADVALASWTVTGLACLVFALAEFPALI